LTQRLAACPEDHLPKRSRLKSEIFEKLRPMMQSCVPEDNHAIRIADVGSGQL
jgi:hypothetical protein